MVAALSKIRPGDGSSILNLSEAEEHKIHHPDSLKYDNKEISRKRINSSKCKKYSRGEKGIS